MWKFEPWEVDVPTRLAPSFCHINTQGEGFGILGLSTRSRLVGRTWDQIPGQETIQKAKAHPGLCRLLEQAIDRNLAGDEIKKESAREGMPFLSIGIRDRVL